MTLCLLVLLQCLSPSPGRGAFPCRQVDLTLQCPLEVPAVHKQSWNFLWRQTISSLQPWQPLRVFVFIAEQIRVRAHERVTHFLYLHCHRNVGAGIAGSHLVVPALGKGSAQWMGCSVCQSQALLQPNKVSCSTAG